MDISISAAISSRSAFPAVHLRIFARMTCSVHVSGPGSRPILKFGSERNGVAWGVLNENPDRGRPRLSRGVRCLRRDDRAYDAGGHHVFCEPSALYPEARLHRSELPPAI